MRAPQGTAVAVERAALEQAMVVLSVDAETFSLAAGAMEELAAHSATAHRMPIADLVTAALSHQHECGVVHCDGDFETLRAHGGLAFTTLRIEIDRQEEGRSKPGRLAPDEFALIRDHAALGAQMLEDVVTPEQASWVRGHHERADGRGYPDGSAGADIPEGARILAVAEACAVMTAARPYAATMSRAEAVAECRREAGAQFDPAVVAALERLLERGSLPTGSGTRVDQIGTSSVPLPLECGAPLKDRASGAERSLMRRDSRSGPPVASGAGLSKAVSPSALRVTAPWIAAPSADRGRNRRGRPDPHTQGSVPGR